MPGLPEQPTPVVDRMGGTGVSWHRYAVATHARPALRPEQWRELRAVEGRHDACARARGAPLASRSRLPERLRATEGIGSIPTDQRRLAA